MKSTRSRRFYVKLPRTQEVRFVTPGHVSPKHVDMYVFDGERSMLLSLSKDKVDELVMAVMKAKKGVR